MTDVDLKQIRRKVYMSYFQDGLWDILLGVFLLGWGLMLTYDIVAASGGVWVAFYFIVLGLKRWLTYPRAGYIRITEEKRQKQRLLIMGLALFFMALMLFLIFNMRGQPPAWLREYFMLFFGTVIAVVTVVLAYWWQVPRWYLYAFVILVSFVAQQWLGLPVNLSFALPGTVIALAGVALLVRFLKKYPRIDREAPDGA